MPGEIDSYPMEKRSFHRFGEVVWSKPSGSLVRDATGAPAHFIAQIEDSTGSLNAYAASRLDWELEDMLGRRGEDLFPKLADTVRARDAELLASGSPLADEMSVRAGRAATRRRTRRCPELKARTHRGASAADTTRRQTAPMVQFPPRGRAPRDDCRWEP